MTELQMIDKEERDLLALREELETERKVFDDRRLTIPEQSARARVRETLAQVEAGVGAGEGTDPRLDAIVRSPEMRALRLKRPGLASLRRLRESLLAAETAANVPTGMWPRPFRLREGRKFDLGDRDMKPGEVIELNESQAAAFADQFESV